MEEGSKELEQDDGFSPTPEEVREEVSKEIKKTNTKDSTKKRYDGYYKEYLEFKKNREIKNNNENGIIRFLMYMKDERDPKISPNTLWSVRSALKAKLREDYNLDIEKYIKLKNKIKDWNKNTNIKQSEVYSVEELTKFWCTAEITNKDVLYAKIFSCLAIHLCCRISELKSVKWEDVKFENENEVRITFPNTKNGMHLGNLIVRQANEKCCPVYYLECYKKWFHEAGFPLEGTVFRRLNPCKEGFLGFKVVNSNIGINKFQDIVDTIDGFLGLE